MGITIQDILTKNPDDLIKEIAIEESKSNPVLDKAQQTKIKNDLKGFLNGDKSLIKRGRVLHVGDHFVTIAAVLPSTQRVFLLVNNFDKTFSLQMSYLLGVADEEFPYKKGDSVTFQDYVWSVKSINPASRNVTLFNPSLGGRKVGISKIKKI